MLFTHNFANQLHRRFGNFAVIEYKWIQQLIYHANLTKINCIYENKIGCRLGSINTDCR